MTNKKLHTANGLLEACLVWQELVTTAAPEDQLDYAAAGVEQARGMNGFYGTDQILVKTDVGLVLGDKFPDVPEAAIFQRFMARGVLRNVVFLNTVGHHSIAWELTDAQLLAIEPEINRQPADGHIEPSLPVAFDEPLITRAGRVRKPIYLPVSFIDLALCAA